MKPTVLLTFFIGCLLISVFHLPILGVNSADADSRLLSRPSANFNVDQNLLVPLDIVNKIALEKALELWGTVTSGEPIPGCDEDGNIVVYMCPFYIGKTPFPDYEQIMEGVKEGRMLVEDVETGFYRHGSVEGQEAAAADLEQRPDEEDTVPSDPSETALSGGTTQKSPMNGEEESYQEALKKARVKELGIGEYGTVYVSARYDRYPIPLCSHYLSPYYFTGDLAREKATVLLGGDPHLAKYYFLGHRGQYFEFVSGKDKILIQAHSLEIESFETVGKGVPTVEQLEDITGEWNKITGAGEVEKGGDS